ncbi:MAG: RNA polymerase sigma factor (sigma-70 family) [Thermoproteota archaeon]
MVNPFSNLTDEKLMELYLSGDFQAFEEIYRRYQGNVYAFLKKRMHNSDNINDVFQNIFIKFHKSKASYKSEFLLIKWLYTICRSEFLDHLKKIKKTLVEISDNDLVYEEKETDIIDINSEKLLSDTEKKALNLRYYSDQDFSEISKALNTTETNIRKIISRGLKKLKTKYGGGIHE